MINNDVVGPIRIRIYTNKKQQTRKKIIVRKRKTRDGKCREINTYRKK